MFQWGAVLLSYVPVKASHTQTGLTCLYDKNISKCSKISRRGNIQELLHQLSDECHHYSLQVGWSSTFLLISVWQDPLVYIKLHCFLTLWGKHSAFFTFLSWLVTFSSSITS